MAKIFCDIEHTGESGNPNGATDESPFLHTECHLPKKPIDSVETDSSTDLPIRKQYRLTYSSWRNAKSRCKHGKYVLHPDFESFESFLSIMGPRPDASYTLDRIDHNNPEYSPGNCRWASKSLQSANRSVKRVIRYLQMELSVSEWSRRTGIAPNTITARLKRGWEPARALTEPVRKRDVEPKEPAWYQQVLSLWCKTINELSKVGPMNLTALDYACLRKIAKQFETDYYLEQDGLRMIEYTIKHWHAFGQHVRDACGLSRTRIPTRPLTTFLLEYLYDMKTFAQDKQHKESLVAQVLAEVE